jgi:hypothetical protein
VWCGSDVLGEPDQRERERAVHSHHRGALYSVRAVHGDATSHLSLCLYLPIEIPYEYLAGKLGTAVT